MIKYPLFVSSALYVTVPADDATRDGRANLMDYNVMLINWKQTVTGCDLDCDGKCRLSDYYFLRQIWNMRSYAPEP